MRITIAGTGYVGLSLATLLSVKNEIVCYDIDKRKIEMINSRISPIVDKEIEEYFQNKKLNLMATNDYKTAFINCNYVIVCTPTNYDENTNYFDTSSINDVLDKITKLGVNPTVVIKSTVPVGYTKELQKTYSNLKIIFSPEFLREGKALYDNLYPSRIIIGGQGQKAEEFAKLLKESSQKKDVDIRFMNSTEAEAVKLFSNTYLALRISYFNELDTYAESKNLNTKDIIEGVCLDPRIGNFYNNPSFGYGGYCLPKDTKQLKANYNNVDENLITAIVKSNDTRKKYIAKTIINKKIDTVGVYRLTMKNNSDNFRMSAVIDIIDELKNNKINIIIYEPTYGENKFMDSDVIKSLDEFKNKSDIILANRFNEELNDVLDKVYTRDLFRRD